MIAMQYRFALPADYDMAVIRQRIADKGHLLDDFPNLAFKAYLYADRSSPIAAARENLYAPFYLWHNTEGMNTFLGGAGFAGVVASFGRPVVRTWSVWQADYAADLSAAAHASRTIVPIPAHTDLAALRKAESDNQRLDRDHGALAAISAFDPTGWSMLRVRLWRDRIEPPLGDEVDVYQIGHISQPQATSQRRSQHGLSPLKEHAHAFGPY